MEQLTARDTGGRLPQGPEVGERVEVATRFTGSWSRGFIVADVEDHAYRLRRLSDGHVLPITFSAHELRVDASRSDASPSGLVHRPCSGPPSVPSSHMAVRARPSVGILVDANHQQFVDVLAASR